MVVSKCKYTRYDMIETLNLEDKLLFEKTYLNVGLLISSKISKNEKQTILRMLIYFCTSYPSSTRITKFNSQKHALYGRRFNTSMLCYDVSNCGYCGKICINHDNNLLIKEKCVIKRSHLTRKKHMNMNGVFILKSTQSQLENCTNVSEHVKLKMRTRM